MTIKLPPERKNGILDKILHLVGRERQLVIPGDININPYDIVIARYEGFWRCLFGKAKDKKSVEEILNEVEGEEIRIK
jgi:hypothetical protein